MASKFESKIGTLAQSDTVAYNFLSDFRNFSKFVPQEKIQQWNAELDNCSFVMPYVGKMQLSFVEKEPCKTIKVSGVGDSNITFNLWVQLKKIAENDTRLKITIEPSINPMMLMMVSKQIQTSVDLLVDKICEMKFDA